MIGSSTSSRPQRPDGLGKPPDVSGDHCIARVPAVIGDQCGAGLLVAGQANGTINAAGHVYGGFRIDKDTTI